MKFFARVPNINFMAQRKTGLVVSTLLSIAAIVLLAVRGLNFGIDFTGGVLVEVVYPQSVELEDVRQPAQGQLFNGAPSGRDQWLASNERLAAATAGLDRIRKRFGAGAIVPATLLGHRRPEGRDGSDGQAGVAGRAPEPGVE